jgi:hypothetical protein
VDVLLSDEFFLDRGPKVGLKVANAILNHILWGTGACGDQDCLDSVQPALVNFGNSVDQMGVSSKRIGDLGKSLAVRTILTP